MEVHCKTHEQTVIFRSMLTDFQDIESSPVCAQTSVELVSVPSRMTPTVATVQSSSFGAQAPAANPPSEVNVHDTIRPASGSQPIICRP